MFTRNFGTPSNSIHINHIAETWNFFFAVQSFDGSGPRDVIYTFDQIDLPELVPLSQLDKREDQLTGEIDELNG